MRLFKTLSVITRVGVGAGIGLVKGVGSTAVDACKIVDRVAHKDWEGSLNIVGDRIERTVHGVGSAVDSTVDLLEDLDSQRDFLRDENVKKMTQVASLGLAVGFGTHLLGTDDIDAGDTDTDYSADADGEILSDAQIAANFGLPSDAIDHGMFVGNESDLQTLIQAGEDPNATHIDSDAIQRDLSVRDEFLAMNNYDAVPQGYEVHHVQPLSEGGSDTIDNMILIDEESHDQITAAHRHYYQWNV